MLADLLNAKESFMPLTFNSAPLEMFSNPRFKDENAIIQLGKDKTLKSDSTFSSANIFRWMRGPETQRKNNEIRTQLLKSLGESFGISGMKTNSNGEITFSKKFMDKLEKLLGPAFKREDFGVPSEGGAVTSGKPLTSRRLNAIYASAKVYDISKLDLADYKQKVGMILKEQFGIETTLGLSQEEFQDLVDNKPALQVYAGIEKSIDFLQNDFKGFFREVPEYNSEKEMGASDEVLKKIEEKFQVKDLETGEYITMGTFTKYEDMIKYSPNNMLFAALRGNLLHTERANFSLNNSRDIDPLNKYVEGTLKGFIKNGVDAYMEAKMNGKVGQLMKLLKSPGACTEEKSQRFYQFRQDNFQQKVDTKLEAELNSVIYNTFNTPLNKVIESEFESIDKQHPEFKTWDDYASELKKRLVGLHRPMVTPTEINGKTEYLPTKDNKGNTVVREIRPEDIDTIGKQVYKAIYLED